MHSFGESSIARTARAARGGSREAFGALVDHFELPLFRYLRVRTGHRADAEELVQDTFLRAWDRIANYDPERPFANWLFTIAVRLAASRARREGDIAEGSEALSRLPDSDDRTLAVDDRDEERNLWRIAARILGPEQRGALWLRYAQGLEAEEVGRMIGKRTVTTRVLLHRARKKLATHLEELEAKRQSGRSCSNPSLPMVPGLPRTTHVGGAS